MEVVWVDLTEAVAVGMTARYVRAMPVSMLAKASGAWLFGLYDLGMLATCKSSLISLNSSTKCPNLQRKNKIKDLFILTIISH
jgi:hypothetical protein